MLAPDNLMRIVGPSITLLTIVLSTLLVRASKSEIQMEGTLHDRPT